MDGERQAERALGKLDPAAFARLIAPHLGATRAEIAVGPRAGHDAAIVRIGGGRVLAMTTDPLSLIPALGARRSGVLAAHLLASDLWTTGIAPAYASVTLNLPPELDDEALGTYTEALGVAWSELGIAVVTGHTGRYEGCAPSIVGAATLVGIGGDEEWIAPSMASPGDRVLLTKGCAVETAIVMAHVAPRRLEERIGRGAVYSLQARLDHVSVVEECRALLAIGVRERGVTALHDATEGGVLGGLLELAIACGHDVRVERARIPLDDDVRGVCDLLGLDPYTSLSEGSLIACVRPERAAAALASLGAAGIAAAEIGEVVAGGGVLHVAEPDGRSTTLRTPPADGYWAAYGRAVREGWE